MLQDDQEEFRGNFQEVELGNRNPPIIGDLARTRERREQGDQGGYGEYFMPVNHLKKSFR